MSIDGDKSRPEIDVKTLKLPTLLETLRRREALAVGDRPVTCVVFFMFVLFF